MNLIRVGDSYVNLDYLIKGDKPRPPDDPLRLMLEEGVVVEVPPEDTDRVLRRLDSIAAESAARYDGPAAKGLRDKRRGSPGGGSSILPSPQANP